MNRQIPVIQLLINSFPELDVLQVNSFGKSCLTEAFNCNNDEILRLILGHPSSSEEKLAPRGVVENENEDNPAGNTEETADEPEEPTDPVESEAITHELVLNRSNDQAILIRELVISKYRLLCIQITLIIRKLLTPIIPLVMIQHRIQQVLVCGQLLWC